ncbi:site-specific DNA-methyltransferase [Mycoplasmopsis felis]|nr:site-specific DNA-methyltransferase [Mycoplasmopsis felis]UWV79441.1 site-specific DNA-methyltransferase [Mycoplasmopsis felis]
MDAKNKSERIELFSGSGQKPEALIQRILNSSTKENDLILDFFLGSGTTAAVAHKMNRRYIGIEQMDYIQDITIERLKKVIDGEQGENFEIS